MCRDCPNGHCRVKIMLNLNLHLFLPVNNYPDAHHSQGGMKFATQISPLLN